MRSKFSKVGCKYFLCRTSTGCLLASAASCHPNSPIFLSTIGIYTYRLLNTVGPRLQYLIIQLPSDCPDSPRHRNYFSVILRVCLLEKRCPFPVRTPMGRRYRLGQKTTVVDCISNRSLPCDLYSAPSLQILIA